MNYGPGYPFSSCHQNLQAMIVLDLLSAWWSEKYRTWYWNKWEKLAKRLHFHHKKRLWLKYEIGDTTILNAFVNKYKHSQENTILCERTWKVLRENIKQWRMKLRLQNYISHWLTSWPTNCHNLMTECFKCFCQYKSIEPKTTSDPVEFHCMEREKSIFKHFFCVRKKKVIQFWKNRVSK